MSDPATLATLIPLVFGIVAALRKEWPTLDGRAVYLVAMALAFVAALLSSSGPIDLVTLRPIAWLGFQVGAGAVALASGINYAADKFSPSPAPPAPVAAPKPPPPAAPGSVAAGSAAALALCLALGCGLLVVASAVSGCSSSALPPVSSTSVTTTITDGCEMVGLLDPAGVTAATVCEQLAPIVGPIVAAVANALGAAHAPTMGEVHLVPLKRAGAVVGYVRADLAAGVQAKFDATAAK